jgi:hypothetical protein
MKLGGKNIISSGRAAKWQTINCFAQRVVQDFREPHNNCGQNKNNFRQRTLMPRSDGHLRLPNLIPAHLRHFESANHLVAIRSFS